MKKITTIFVTEYNYREEKIYIDDKLFSVKSSLIEGDIDFNSLDNLSKEQEIRKYNCENVETNIIKDCESAIRFYDIIKTNIGSL